MMYSEYLLIVFCVLGQVHFLFMSLSLFFVSCEFSLPDMLTFVVSAYFLQVLIMIRFFVLSSVFSALSSSVCSLFHCSCPVRSHLFQFDIRCFISLVLFIPGVCSSSSGALCMFARHVSAYESADVL